MALHLRLARIRSEIEMFENPEIRKIYEDFEMHNGNFTIENVVLDCRNVRNGIIIKNGEITLKNCKIIGDGSSSIHEGITVSGNSKLSLEKTILDGFATGIFLLGCSKLSIHSTNIQNCHVGIEAEYGIWQGAVAVTDDWLICGRGPRGAMFRLRSKECTYVFSFPGRIHCAGFLDDMIFLAGEHSHLQEYGFNGEVTAGVPVSRPAAYSVCFQTDPLKIMSLGGASNSLDLCTNYNY